MSDKIFYIFLILWTTGVVLCLNEEKLTTLQDVTTAQPPNGRSTTSDDITISKELEANEDLTESEIEKNDKGVAILEEFISTDEVLTEPDKDEDLTELDVEQNDDGVTISELMATDEDLTETEVETSNKGVAIPELIAPDKVEPKIVSAGDVEATAFENFGVVENLEDVQSKPLQQVKISYGCPANNKLPCIAKCCNISESQNPNPSTENGTRCVRSEDDFFVNFVDRSSDYGRNMTMISRYEYFIGNPCVNGMFLLDPEFYKEDAYSLYSNGTLLLGEKFISMQDYCVDNLNGSLRAFVCFESISATAEVFNIIYPAFQILSVFFLLATAATYLFIEKFRDLQGKSLVCHVLCLSMAFSFLAMVQLSNSSLPHSLCTASAFIIQFSFIACFFWLNVLSCENYLCIRNSINGNPGSWHTERKMFILYSLYAWNGPLLLFIVTMVFDFVAEIPDTLVKPNFGTTSCWFSTDTAALPYFFVPVGILMAINLTFFILSAYTIGRGSTFKYRKSYDPDAVESKDEQKKKKILNRCWRGMKKWVALFIIMGLSWITEVISWAAGGSRYIWVTTDIINTLQGVLIFVVFVYRPVPVRKAVLKNLRLFWGIVTHCDRHYKAPEEHQPIDRVIPLPIRNSDSINGTTEENQPMVSFSPDKAD